VGNAALCGGWGLLLRDTEAEIAAKKGRAFISCLSGEGAGAAALLARKSIGLLARHGGVQQDATKLKGLAAGKS
jgi:hypothetical protein